MLRGLSIAVLLSLTIACGKDEARLTVAVDGTSFNRVALPSGAGQLASVPFTVTNHGGATAFVAVCGPQVSPVIERFNGEDWQQYSGGFCVLDVISEPLELRDGESQSAVAVLSEAGRFRIRVRYSDNAGMNISDQPRSAPSRAFDVR